MLHTSMTWNDPFLPLQGTGVTVWMTVWAVLGGIAPAVAFGPVRAGDPWWVGPMAGVRPSMGSVGAFGDAMAEISSATLECESLARRRFASRAEARTARFGDIKGRYDPVRLHSALGDRSPMAYEQENTPETATQT